MIVRENVASPAIIVVGDVVLRSDAQNALLTMAQQAAKQAELTP
jgi:uroporphyrin-III C-methyltransferase